MALFGDIMVKPTQTKTIETTSGGLAGIGTEDYFKFIDGLGFRGISQRLDVNKSIFPGNAGTFDLIKTEVVKAQKSTAEKYVKVFDEMYGKNMTYEQSKRQAEIEARHEFGKQMQFLAMLYPKEIVELGNLKTVKGAEPTLPMFQNLATAGGIGKRAPRRRRRTTKKATKKRGGRKRTTVKIM